MNIIERTLLVKILSNNIQWKRYSFSHVKNCFIIVLLIFFQKGFADESVVFTLDDCINTALAKNQSIKLAQEKIVELNAKVKESRTGFLPKISASAAAIKLDEAPYMDMSKLSDFLGSKMASLPKTQNAPAAGNSKIIMGSDKMYNIVLAVQQPLFTGGKIVNGFKAAQNSLKAVKENESKTERDVVLDVKKLFFTILQTERMVEVTDTSIRQLEGIVKDLENMKDQGMVGDPEVMNANVQLYNTQLMRVKAVNGVTLTKSTLCNTMGIDWNTSFTLKYDLTEPINIGITELQTLVQKAQTTQSEVKALEYQRAALKNVVDINKANYLPTIVAAGNYNFKNPNRSYQEEFYSSWDLTLALKMNLFDWGEGYNKSAQANSQLRQIDNNMVQLKNGLAITVEKNYLAVEEAFTKIDLNRKTLVKAQSSYNITLDKFQVGMAKNADLLDAQRVLTQAKIDFYNSVTGYYTAHAELEHLIENK
jgi:outer membrane protein TolC